MKRCIILMIVMGLILIPGLPSDVGVADTWTEDYRADWRWSKYNEPSYFEQNVWFAYSSNQWW